MMQPTRLPGFTYTDQVYNPDDFMRFLAQQKSQQKPQSKSKKGTGRWGSNPLSAFISELGGAGGAAGGAAIGAGLGSVVPGLGTAIGGLIGAGVGGFAGGFGGRLAENQMRDNEMRVGDALKEGAFSGVSSALFPGGRALASGGKSLLTNGGLAGAKEAAKSSLGKSFAGSANSGIAKLLSGGTSAAGATDDVLRGGLQRAGDAARAFPRGIKPGAQFNANKYISTKQAQEINAAINKATKGKMSAWTPTKQFTAVEQRLQSLYDDFAKGGEPGKAVINTDDIAKKITDNINKSVSLRGNLSKTNQKVLDNIMENVSNLKGKSAREVFELAEEFNSLASNIVDKGNIGSKEVKIYEAARRALKNHIDDMYPGKSALNKEVSSLQQAKGLLSKAVESDVKSTGSQGYQLGILAKKGATPVIDSLGRGLQTVGGATNPYRKLPVGANLVRQAPYNVLEAGTTPMPKQMSEEDQKLAQVYEQFSQFNPDDPFGGYKDYQAQTASSGLDGQLSSALMSGQGMTGMGGQMPQQTAYSLEQAIADIQAAPDAKTQKAIMDYYDFVSKAEAAQNKTVAGGPNITKVTGQQYVLASRGANAVDELEKLLSTNPSVLNKTATPGRKLPIVGGFISNAAGTGNFDAIGYNVANALLRLETGAQANPEEIKNLQAQMMPRAGDSPQTVQIKLAQLRQAFSAFLNTANGQDTLAGQIESYQPTQYGIGQ